MCERSRMPCSLLLSSGAVCAGRLASGLVNRERPGKLAEPAPLRAGDRARLEPLAKQLDMTVSQVEQIDEQPGWIFQRMFSGNIHNRYFKALEQKTREEAARGD